MPKEPIPNLTRLPPRDECLARIALGNMPQDQRRLGLTAVLGPPHGSAIVLTSAGRDGEQPGLNCGVFSSTAPGDSERDV